MPTKLHNKSNSTILKCGKFLGCYTLFCCKCVCRSWKNLISDPNNHKKLP